LIGLLDLDLLQRDKGGIPVDELESYMAPLLGSSDSQNTLLTALVGGPVRAVANVQSEDASSQQGEEYQKLSGIIRGLAGGGSTPATSLTGFLEQVVEASQQSTGVELEQGGAYPPPQGLTP